MRKHIYGKLATFLSVVAVFVVSTASVAWIYNPKPPEELLKR